MYLSLNERTASFLTVVPQVIAADTQGTVVDLGDFPEEAYLICTAGEITDGAYRFDVKHSDTSTGTFAALTDSDGNNVTSQIFSSTNDEKLEVIKLKNYKRFVRVDVTETTSGSTGGPLGAVLIGVYKLKK
jgi:hypothetical protein